MTYKLKITAVILSATLALAGCASSVEEPVSPEATETTVPQDQADANGQQDIATKIDYLALSTSEFFAFAEDNVVLRDQEEFELALTKSIEKASKEGMVEISRIASGILTTSNYVPPSSSSGVTFVAGDDGKVFEDSISIIDGAVLNLYSLARSLKANAFRGVIKQPNGEIILKLVPGGESDDKFFVFVVSVNSDGLIDSIISAGNYEENPPIIETQVKYESPEEAVLMLEQLSQSS